MSNSRFEQSTHIYPGALVKGECGCGHPFDGHDRVAQRFCAATRSGQLVRNCICVPAVGAALDLLTGRALLHRP
jgi:hypothetical protein